jgi:SAM-dependent methyltransferase
MYHVVYDEWLDHIGRIAHRFSGKVKPSIFEIGGGTGILGALLRRNGYPYVGSDLSFDMCRQMRKRIDALCCADGLCLPLKTTFEMILFLYDGINYLQTPQEYTALFNEAYRCLDREGLFLFDITTRTNSVTYFYNHVEYKDYGDSFYVRQSYYDDPERMQYNDFTIFRRVSLSPERFEKVTEHHAQKLFNALAIKNLVPQDRFTVVGIWDGYTFNPYTKHSERVHFLLKKK